MAIELQGRIIPLQADGLGKLITPVLPQQTPDEPVITAEPLSSTSNRITLTSSTGADSVRLEVSTDGSTGWAQLTAAMDSAYDHTGLTAESLRYYRPTAVNASGEAVGAVVSAVTDAASGGQWTEGQEPEITSAGGSVAQGETLTLSGSNFSAESAQVFYDDFTDGVLGANLDTTPGWERSDANGPYVYVDDDTFIAGRSVRVDMATGYDFKSAYFLPDPQDEIYVECWFKANVIYWGSTADGDAPQVKMFRPNGSTSMSNKDEHPWVGITQFGEYGGAKLTQGGATTDLPTSYDGDCNLHDGWQRYACYLKVGDIDTPNGKRYVKYGPEDAWDWSSLPAGGHYASPTGEVPPTAWDGEEIITNRGAEGDGLMRHIFLPFFTRTYQDLTIDVAGFFVNKTPERVYLGDASTWDTCTKRIIQPTLSRSPDSLDIKQELTPFAAGPLYAYVVNRDHVFNVNGFKVRD